MESESGQLAANRFRFCLPLAIVYIAHLLIYQTHLSSASTFERFFRSALFSLSARLRLALARVDKFRITPTR